jgi:type I restriction enzyme S subunit
MRNDRMQSIADLADVNPPIHVRLPAPSAEVSFVPMPDVSESGEWVHRRTRRLAELGTGFTPFQEGDVLFAKITPCMENGKGFLARGLANGVGFGSTEFHVLRAKPGVDPRFVYHLVHWPAVRKKAECMMIGSAGQQRVAAEFFSLFWIGLFDVTAQRHVADILDAADGAIRKTEAVIAKLKLMKDGLLHDLLTRGLDAHGRLRDNNAHPEQFKDSPLGRIPEDWICAEMAKVTTAPEYGVSVPLYDAGETPVLRMNNLSGGHINLSELRYSSDPSAGGLLLQLGDILFNRTNSIDHVGRTSIWNGEIARASFASYCVRFTSHREIVTPEFLVYFMNLPKTQLAIKRLSTPAVQQVNVNPTKLRQQLLVVYPKRMKEQDQIVQMMKAAEELVRMEHRELQKLRLQKSGLMHDLFTGRVPVAADEVAKRG